MRGCRFSRKRSNSENSEKKKKGREIDFAKSILRSLERNSSSWRVMNG
jgi:hypothetical protein